MPQKYVEFNGLYVPRLLAEKPSRPERGAVIAGYRSEFDAMVGKLDLTPAKMGQILRDADVGNINAMVEMFDAIEEDPHVHATLSKRRRAVTTRKIAFYPAVDDDIRASDAAELAETLITGKDGEDGIANWREALWDMTDAIGRAYSVLQTYWDSDGSIWRPTYLQRWSQINTAVGNPSQPGSTGINRRQDEVRILTDEQPVNGEVPDPWQFVVHISRARSTGLHKAALLRIIAFYFLFKKFGLKGWTIFTDRYGIPMRLGKYPKHADEDERAAILEAAVSLGQDGAAVFPVDAMLELIESTKGAGQLPHEPLVRFCNAEISKAILGNTLSTEVTSSGGNRALGEVHERTEEDIAAEDAAALANTIRRDLVTPIVRFNMPEGTPIPRVSFIAEEQVDLLKVAQMDSALINAGLPLSAAQLYETYGRRPPESEEDALTGTGAAPILPVE